MSSREKSKLSGQILSLFPEKKNKKNQQDLYKNTHFAHYSQTEIKNQTAKNQISA